MTTGGDQTKKTNRTEQIGVGCADIGEQELKYLMQALSNQRLSYGPLSARFEKEFSAHHGVKYGIFCNSGTSALQMSVACLKETEGWKDGDEILVPSVTFVATSNVVLQNSLTPVFVDVDPLTYNMDPAQISKHLTPRSKAIIPVHLFGLPCDMDPILEIAKKNKLKIIEDSCETMFTKYKGQPVGSFGDIACFSTYVAHLIVTGVGGFAITNNLDYAVILKSLMNHGRDSIYLSIDDDKKKDSDQLRKVIGGRFRFARMGYSYRATEMEAALGLGQLERLGPTMLLRQKNAKVLIDKLKHLSDFIQLPTWSADREHAFMMFPIMILDGRVKKEDLTLYLEKNFVETRDMLPLINQPFYKKMFGDLESQYPAAKKINECGFYIGCHQKMSADDIDYVCGIFDNYFRENKLI